MSIRIFIENNGDTFKYKREYSGDFEIKPKAYQLFKHISQIKKHKADNTKYFTVLAKSIHKEELLFNGVLINEIEVDGTVYSTYEELSSVLSPILYSSGGSSVQKDIVLNKVSYDSTNKLIVKWTINNGVNNIKIQQSTDDGVNWVDSTTAETISTLDDSAEITSLEDYQTYLIRLVYNDNTPSNTVKHINQDSSITAGIVNNDETITLPTNSITLDGSLSKSPNGVISSYLWEVTSGPSDGVLANSSSVRTLLSELIEGEYTIKLTVTDGGGATSSDIRTITVEGEILESRVLPSTGWDDNASWDDNATINFN